MILSTVKILLIILNLILLAQPAAVPYSTIYNRNFKMSLEISLDANTIAFLISIAFWIATIVIIVAAARWWPAAQNFRKKMARQWKPALGITILYLLAAVLGGQDAVSSAIVALTVFCQALIGLTLAYNIRGFEPLPATRAFLKREHIRREIGLLVGLSLLLVPVSLFIGTIGLNLGENFFGEVQQTGAALETLPGHPAQVFFMLLAGAGIAEELVYRLVLLTLIWRLTCRPWIAIIISSILMGAYHLTPLSSMYLEFWQYPVSQFLAATFISVLWGYVYTRRGLETVVLTHTLSDWLSFLLYVSFNGV